MIFSSFQWFYTWLLKWLEVELRVEVMVLAAEHWRCSVLVHTERRGVLQRVGRGGAGQHVHCQPVLLHWQGPVCGGVEPGHGGGGCGLSADLAAQHRGTATQFCLYTWILEGALDLQWWSLLFWFFPCRLVLRTRLWLSWEHTWIWLTQNFAQRDWRRWELTFWLCVGLRLEPEPRVSLISPGSTCSQCIFELWSTDGGGSLCLDTLY